MTQRSVTYLKGKFEEGDTPSGTDFSDIFDSFVSLESSAEQSMAGKLTAPSVSAASGVIRTLIRGTQAITPTGATQASAFAVTADIVMASAEQVERAIVLPTLTLGRQHNISNTGTTALAIYPPTGENFVGTAANGGIAIAAGQSITIFHGVSAYGFVRST